MSPLIVDRPLILTPARGWPISDETVEQQPVLLDESEPTPQRQAELRAAYEANVAAGKAPYESVSISTRGELRWVMRQRRWSGEATLSPSYARASLSGANLHGANLSGTDLRGANLSGTLLGGTNLSAADLRDANLNGARMAGVNLSGTDLRGARMMVETGLARATFSTTTCLADVVWNDAPLARVAWEELPRVGDEAAARQRADADGKIKDVATHRIDAPYRL